MMICHIIISESSACREVTASSGRSATGSAACHPDVSGIVATEGNGFLNTSICRIKTLYGTGVVAGCP